MEAEREEQAKQGHCEVQCSFLSPIPLILVCGCMDHSKSQTVFSLIQPEIISLPSHTLALHLVICLFKNSKITAN